MARKKHKIDDHARQLMAQGGRKGGRKKNMATTNISHTNPDMIISKKDAVALGFTVYRTGEPCKNGHTGWRRTYNHNCIECKSKVRHEI